MKNDMMTKDWLTKLARADQKYGMEIMEGSVQVLRQKLGDDYEYERGVIPFALGEYLQVREDIMTELGIGEGEIKKFDLRVKEIIR